MPLPASVAELVERFHRNLESYKKNGYSETEARIEFINPLFEALGWDLHNRQGYAEAYKDVVHEDAIKVGGVNKAPDYSFRIGGVRKFFLEAKKPSVDIKNDIHPAYQLRRYAWSAKLPLSILTDFEEFAVYDCRPKPDPKDGAATARTIYMRYTDYAERWDELESIFSRDAILKGSFDKYADSHKAKKGTAEVDHAFLEEIERWRDLLARNIALRNEKITQRELNFAVQQTIDRIIFLRICEDRGIEGYGTLMALQNGAEVYPRLLHVFQLADARYNSGLFHFENEKGREGYPDTLTPTLKIDDKVLRDVLKNLYYPDSPYEFSVLPADILGQIYEQFLGKVIRLTSGHQAKVEEKPEVKKAGGVYYTPTYIVNYIVKETVGKLLEGKAPGPRGGVSKLRILDPACGSGSFLIGAYQFLLDWHLQRYIAENPEQWANKRNPQLYKSDKGEWRLTIDERKRILLNNIYGVDIDLQAVEVTKLSLLLKVLEGESEQTLSPQMALIREGVDRVLPDLAHNIRCGNSLIGPDFYSNQLALFDEEEAYRINVFDWQSAFPEVFAEGGFDGVIGNPPYIQSRSGLLVEKDKAYFETKFRTTKYQLNTYSLFTERSILLLRAQGILGFIIPNYWLSNDADLPLRKFLFIENSTIEIVNLYRVFQNATVDTLILICNAGKGASVTNPILVRSIDRNLNSIAQRLNALSSRFWSYEEAYGVNTNPSNLKIGFHREISLSASHTLEEYCSFKFGMKPYQIGKGNPSQTPKILKDKSFNSNSKSDNSYEPLLNSGGVKRFRLDWKGEWIKYGEHLAEPRSLELFTGPRILVNRIFARQKLDGTYTEENYVCNTDVITIQLRSRLQHDLRFFLGIILSSTCASSLKSDNVNLDRSAYPKINTKTLAKLPIRAIDFANHADVALHDRMVSLVQRMLDLHKQLATATLPHQKSMLQMQIDATDRQIDQLVYELYGLTQEEIAIVEGKD